MLEKSPCLFWDSPGPLAHTPVVIHIQRGKSSCRNFWVVEEHGQIWRGTAGSNVEGMALTGSRLEVRRPAKRLWEDDDISLPSLTQGTFVTALANEM